MNSTVAVITGGGQGLGRAFAENLLERNYRVALLDINTKVGNATNDDFIKAYGAGRSLFIKCDVRNQEEIEEAFKRAQNVLGKIDVVVNNAGISNERDWRKMIQINLELNEPLVLTLSENNGLVDGTYTAVEHLRRDRGGKGGVIVNIASTAGLTAVPLGHVYVGTKHAVVGFSRSVAATCELMKDKWHISVLCLCPSYTDTEIIQGAKDTSIKSPITPVELSGVSQSFIERIGVNKLTSVVDAFENLLGDNVNGAVMAITPRGKQYRYPHELKAAKL